MKEIRNYFVVVVMILGAAAFTQSCNNEEEEITPTLAIGDFHQGGVIFYLDETAEHGLIVAVADQGFNDIWGCPPLIINGANGVAIGTGVQNTIDILARCSTAGIAADKCDKLDQNGFSDWFLASKEELDMLYQNRDKVNETSIANGGRVLEGTEYWTSSLQNSNTVWIQNFVSGNQFGASEDAMYNVRAIRAF